MLQGYTDKLLGNAAPIRLSMTSDRGRKMAMHIELSQRTGIAVYFCNPQRLRQRGPNESTNGLLGGASTCPRAQTYQATVRINAMPSVTRTITRPRKALSKRLPLAVYSELFIDIPSTLTSFINISGCCISDLNTPLVSSEV